MGMKIPCSQCGLRPYTEFSFGGEWRASDGAGPAEDFERVYLRENAAGPQRERWFHALGCRRWSTLTRDTVTHQV